MKKLLYIPNSYKAIDSKIDSSFSPYQDPEFIESVIQLNGLGEKMEEIEPDIKLAKSTMAIWVDSRFSSSYAKNQYEEAKAEYDEAFEKYESLSSKRQAILNRLREEINKEPEFIGYMVFHTYRAKNNIGQNLIGQDIFFVDKDLTEVLAHTSTEELESYKEALEELSEK